MIVIHQMQAQAPIGWACDQLTAMVASGSQVHWLNTPCNSSSASHAAVCGLVLVMSYAESTSISTKPLLAECVSCRRSTLHWPAA